MATVRGYQAQNLKALINGLRLQVNGILKPQLLKILYKKAEEIVSYIDNGADIPEYLSHLHDATGVGVYADGKVRKFIPTKKATKLGKSGFDGINHYGIDGNKFLIKSISDAKVKFGNGIWFVLFSAVPYAYHIDAFGSPLERGKDFFKELSEKSVNEIISGLVKVTTDIKKGSIQV